MGNLLQDNTAFRNSLRDKVKDIMVLSDWLTIAEVSDKVGHLFNQSSVSAAMRSLRNVGLTVNRRINHDNPELGKYQYKIASKGERMLDDVGIFRFTDATDDEIERFEHAVKMKNEDWEN